MGRRREVVAMMIRHFQQNPRLTVLHLSMFKGMELDALVDAFPKDSLRRLIIHANAETNEDGHEFVKLTAQLTHLRVFEYYNEYGSTTDNHLASRMLHSLTHLAHLEVLKLYASMRNRQDELSVDGLVYFLSNSKSMKELHMAVLNQNNLIPSLVLGLELNKSLRKLNLVGFESNQAFVHVVNAIQQHPTLEDVVLESAQISNDQQYINAISGLFKNTHQLKSLELYNIRLLPQHAIEAAKALAENTKLKKLKINQKYKASVNAWIKMLSFALQHNTHLVVLDLTNMDTWQAQSSSVQILPLLMAISSNTVLRHLSLKHYQFNNEEAKWLALALSMNKHLQYLFVLMYEVHADGWLAFGDALLQHPSLTRVILQRYATNISKEVNLLRTRLSNSELTILPEIVY
jgi:hypothetical protein